ncbi:MAG: hypothetical protein KF744_14435 [Taibaiella sp.]|nr:hypothetical protein [Taibaiella sp.]
MKKKIKEKVIVFRVIGHKNDIPKFQFEEKGTPFYRDSDEVNFSTAFLDFEVALNKFKQLATKSEKEVDLVQEEQRLRDIFKVHNPLSLF